MRRILIYFVLVQALFMLGCAVTPQQQQQADAMVATAQKELDFTKAELAAVKASATTQPANPDLTKRLAQLEDALAKAQKGVDYANAANQALNHGDPGPLLAAVSTLGPYGPLIGLGLGVAYGVYQQVRASSATKAVAATTDALNQYAQTVNAVVPNDMVHTINSTVDSTTRAAVAKTGVVPIPDPEPEQPKAIIVK